MSMLSAQCDELRSMAESVGLAMPQAATLMIDAADTITELRGALQVASVDYRHLKAEHDKLRGARDVWQENDAKLRELVRELYEDQCDECDRWKYRDRMRELGIELNDYE